MIATPPTLTPRERRALRTLVREVVRRGDPPIRRVLLFGSKARGDFDDESDVDALFLCDVHPDERRRAALVLHELAARVARETGVEIEPWAVPAADLQRGRRTPMLVDALDDSVPLWPPGSPPLRLPFTPEDAAFCADCLLQWVEDGGPIVRDALEAGEWAHAATRARDDITRLATALLLLDGDTRHRRRSSLRRFEERFVRPRIVSPRVLPALAWAAAAYPPDGGRGDLHPPVTATAAFSAPLGYRLASIMQAHVAPLVLERLGAARGFRIRDSRARG